MREIYTKKTLIDKLKRIRAEGWQRSIKKCSNDGAVGNTLEYLLDIEENNLPLPNASEWELKAQRLNTNSLLTLFHCDPSPRALKVISWLVENYGWKHQKAGSLYSENEKSFRQTLNYKYQSGRGFSLFINEKEQKIQINFDYNFIDDKYLAWKCDLQAKGLDVFDKNFTPYWGYNDIFYKAGTKLGNCFFVLADSKVINGLEFFNYNKIYQLSDFKLNNFIMAIKNGYIYIDIDARSGHNHGTKFRIRRDMFTALYENVVVI